MIEYTNNIITEYKNVFSKEPINFEKIKRGVSEKVILRIRNNKKDSIIGIYNKNLKENNAFFSFTKTFSENGLLVPEILYISKNKNIYFLNDLGKPTLFDYIISKPHRFSLFQYYKKSLQDLLNFQITGKHYIDFNKCYETKVFDAKQINFDIAKFENYFIKLHLKNRINLNIKDVSLILTKIVYEQKNDYFMYRDFQPRNIIKNKQKLFYVDYQSGRMGPLQYDLISFLYSGSIDITKIEREELIKYYLEILSGIIIVDKNKFHQSLKYFTLLRLMQILGSYCYSNYENKNSEMLNKIPTAIENLKTLNFDEIILQKFVDEIITTHNAVHQLD